MRISSLLALFLTLTCSAGAAPPATWEARGPGGGGALFSPSWSPHAADELFLACDMSELFHSTDGGGSWTAADFRTVQGGHQAKVQFTSDPQLLYVLDYTSLNGVDWRRPVRSTDGGATWSVVAADPTGGDAYSLWVDFADPQRILINDWNRMYASLDGGASFQAKYTALDNGAGNLIAGVFFDGANIYVGTNDGLVVSNDGGASFALVALGGIAPNEHMLTFAGARQGTTTRLLTVTASSVWNGVMFWDGPTFEGVYSLDVGAASWVARDAGLAPGVHPWFVGMTGGDVATAYLAGNDSNTSYPFVYRTTDGGMSWRDVLGCMGNSNVATGWSGFQGDRDWWFGEAALGFAVSPVDGNRVAIADYGFIHVTTDGGTTWRQGYVAAADANPMGAPTPKRRSYHSVGLEDTTSWCLAWADADNLMACYSDINGTRSTDGGATWGFNYTGHNQNSLYRVVRHPSGVLYGATATVHDLYQSTYLQDSRIDGGSGRVIFSTDQGQTWQQLGPNIGRPVVWVAADPSAPNRLYASVVHSSQGGIWVSNDIQNGTAATWNRLATQPPRTEGHPFNIVVLADGTLVVSFSARRNAGGMFTASSGVFLSGDGGATWADRSAPNLLYWTKDVVVDPHDPTGNTWYAGVFSGWGGAPNDKGGLYRTRDRGMNWTRLVDNEGVTSITIHPSNPDEAYMTTQVRGLHHTEDLNAPGGPTWTATTYPFRQPERVFFNPFDVSEVWVTSFGNGLRVGSTAATGQVLLRNTEVTRIDPPTPALNTILPLSAPDDRYPGMFARGDSDPDVDIVIDQSAPLTFYALEGNGVLQLTKAGTTIGLWF